MNDKRFTVYIAWANYEKTETHEVLLKYGGQPIAEITSYEDAWSVRDIMNEMHEEKEFWKSNACSQSSFNSILLNELDIAIEQGYEVSDPFKKLMEDKK